MKNLKKVLALVLALATVFGLGVSASAKYTDASSIKYTEAVDVMSAIGVLGGNPDGSFAPEANLTRVQAAKMVSYILNGGKDVNDLYSGANTFTDCYNSWGKGYIAYVNQMGIVAGVGNGKFNPDGTLTGVALAKMMLTSLGYDANVEGYQANNNWMVNIIDDAQSAGLLKGLDGVNLYNAITREQASQMMFNALKATMVRYDNKGTEITLPGGGTIVTNPSSADPIKLENETNNYAGKDNAGYGTQQLCEKYFAKLELKAGSPDAFGRQGNKWTYDNSTVGTYGTTADYTVVLDQDYSKKNNAKDFLKVLQDLTGNDDLSLYTVGAVDDVKLYINGKDMSKQDFGPFAKAGATVELFCDGDVIKSIVAYTENLYKITSVDTDVKSADAKKGVSAYVTIGEHTYNDIDIPGYDAKTYVEGAYVAAVLDGDDDKTILSSYIPEAVTGYATAKSDTTVTVGGNQYVFAGVVEATDVKLGADNEFTMYLDKNGYILGIPAADKTVTDTDVLYVTYAYETTGTWGATEKMFQGVLADGTVVTGKRDNGWSNGEAINKSVRYTVENGVYKFQNDTTDNGVGVVALSGKETTKSTTKLSIGGKTYYFGSNVNFVYMNGNKDDLKVTTKDGVQAYKFGANDYAEIVKDADGNLVISTVFVKGNAVTSSDDLIYAVANTKTTSDTKIGEDGKTTLYGYEVYLNGEQTVIYTTSKSSTYGGFYTYSVDETTGAYTLNDTDAGVLETKTIEKNGTVYVNGNYYVTIEGKEYTANDAKVIDTKSDRNINSMSKLKKATDAGTASVSVVTDGESAITYIYVG